VLVLGECHTHDVDVVLLQRPLHERTPAAADVKQRHTGLEPQLAEAQFELGDLSFIHRHVFTREVRAAIGHRGIREQLKELVGDVVVRAYLANALPLLRRRRGPFGHHFSSVNWLTSM
jgi:hypothetical protein